MVKVEPKIFYKQRIFCETENQYVECECLLPTIVCPNDVTHTVTSGSQYFTDTPVEKDYRALRAQAAEYVTTTGYDNLTEDQQEVALHNFIAPDYNIFTEMTLEDRLKYGAEFHINASAARQHREYILMTFFYNVLPLNQCFEIVNGDVQQLLYLYTEAGLEGTTVGDPEGIFDWILATSGTSFEETGLPTRSGLTPYGFTLEQIVNIAYEIMISGTISGTYYSK